MNGTFRQSIKVTSGAITSIATIVFAYILYAKGIHLNLTTWLLILLLDSIGLILVYKGGDTRPWLLIGWTTAALCVVIAIIITGGRVTLTAVEAITLSLAVFAIWQWLRSGKPVIGLRWQSIAMWLSSLPMLYDFWRQPQPWTWWLWAITIICCVTEVAATDDRSEIKILVQLSAIGLNTIALGLVLH